MQLEGERIYLRPWELSDQEQLYELAKNPKIGLQAGWPPHKNVEESAYIIKEILTCWGFFAIIEKSSEKLLGCVNLLIGDSSNFDIGEQEGEIGYWIGEPFWGNGYATEAVDLIIDYGLEELGLEQIWCGYFDGNTQSRRVQEKCGFIYDHTIEQVHTLFGEDKREIVMKLDLEG